MGYDKTQAEHDLIKAGAILKRHGSNHDIWDLNGKMISIPRRKSKDLSPRIKSEIDKLLGR